MPGTSKNRTKRRSSNVRSDIQKSKQRKRSFSGDRISGRKRIARPGIATNRVYRASFLNWPLKPISAFKITERYCNTIEDLQEQLPRLYKCLKNIPEFKDDKEWNEIPAIHEIADYLFSEVEKVLPEGFSWQFHQIYDSEESPYELVFYRERHDLDKNIGGLSFEWTQYIKDPELLELIHCVVNRVWRDFNLGFIDDYHYEIVINDSGSFTSDDEIEDDMFLSDVLKYKKGGRCG